MDIQIRSFFVTFTSLCIQAADCTKLEDALVKARSIVAEQEPMLESFLRKFVEQWDIETSGLTITTKPLSHELYHDKRPEQRNIYGIGWKAPREAKYSPGSAIIHIPIPSLNPRIEFTNQEFIHGHLLKDTNNIGCWGPYKSIQRTALEGGPLAVLSSMYGFCKFSRYGTHLRSEELSNA